MQTDAGSSSARHTPQRDRAVAKRAARAHSQDTGVRECMLVCAFRALLCVPAPLQVDLSPLSRAELLAFGINLYNALIVHATVVLGAPTTTLERAAFFSKNAAYVIGGHKYACASTTCSCCPCPYACTCTSTTCACRQASAPPSPGLAAWTTKTMRPRAQMQGRLDPRSVLSRGASSTLPSVHGAAHV